MSKAKNEDGKDLLFSKLLPALNSNPFSSTYKGAQEAAGALVTPEDSDPVSKLRGKLFARSSQVSSDTFTAINVVEYLIPKYIDQAIRRFNACTCDRCRCDVAAHALNNISPMYLVVNLSDFTPDDDPAVNKQIMDALVNAVIHVRSRPNH